jgi:hypothetical protein
MNNSRWTATLMAAWMQAARAGQPAFLNSETDGGDARRLHDVAPEYSLHIEFRGASARGPDAGAEVEITRADGSPVFHLARTVPLLLVHLAPGCYRVTARRGGACETQTATIASHGTSTLYFNAFPQQLHPRSDS